jgi:outer membrane protein TolC
LARIRYRGSVSSYLEVLDSERERSDAELVVVRTRRGDLVAVVRLCNALDGGWQEPPSACRLAP